MRQPSLSNSSPMHSSSFEEFYYRLLFAYMIKKKFCNERNTYAFLFKVEILDCHYLTSLCILIVYEFPMIVEFDKTTIVQWLAGLPPDSMINIERSRSCDSSMIFVFWRTASWQVSLSMICSFYCFMYCAHWGRIKIKIAIWKCVSLPAMHSF